MESCGENNVRILQINSVCGVGSTGRIMLDIHNLLLRNGHESYMAYGREAVESCNNTIKIGNKIDIYMHVAKTRIFDKHGFGSKKATLKFIKEIQKIDPDIIHLHNVHGYYLNIEVLFKFLKKYGKPVVWTLHDCWAFTGHCAHFDYVGCDKWETGCNKCPQKNRYPKSLLIDNSKSNYEKKKELFTGLKNMTIVTPSKWLLNLLKKSFLKEYDAKVINNGIDLNAFKPTESNFRTKHHLEDEYIILGVANIWDERKGLKYFFDLSELIDDDSKIILVGLNDKQLKNLPKNVVGIKRTNSVKELAEIYSTANIFVNPTLEDNLPTVNLEALSCGIPVITFNTGGSVECIDKSCGIIVEKGNLKELMNSIRRIKNMKIDKNKCIQRAKMFNKDDKFMEYIELYKEKLKRV